VTSGETHSELCSSEHVWAVIATKEKKNSNNNNNNKNDTKKKEAKTNDSGDDENNNKNNENSNEEETNNSNEQPLVFLIKPCKNSLVDGFKTSILLTPWYSLSIKQKQTFTLNRTNKTTKNITSNPTNTNTMTSFKKLTLSSNNIDSTKSKYNTTTNYSNNNTSHSNSNNRNNNEEEEDGDLFANIHVQFLDGKKNNGENIFDEEVLSKHKSIALPKWPKRKSKP
jgi:hypothetical protein